MSKKVTLPCPHCGKDINPAKMLAHLRMVNMTPEDRKRVASAGGRALKSKREPQYEKEL